VDEVKSRLLGGLGIQGDILQDPDGRAELQFLVADHHCHAVAQGGYVTAWIDSAMAHAVNAVAGDEVFCNTLEIKVAFYRPALVGQIVTAVGWIERLGRNITFVEGELRDESGKVLAKGTSTARLTPVSKEDSG
jgi:acyl-CoA thioesterase